MTNFKGGVICLKWIQLLIGREVVNMQREKARRYLRIDCYKIDNKCNKVSGWTTQNITTERTEIPEDAKINIFYMVEGSMESCCVLK
ncbi:hypothetical protein [Wolbachia endosymbiont (group A) of Philonthus cognatus]|uniref:hypothetical protein n=1 Tax=Wolbachia endosymbiont (group A) of Philonthus cognatus TaxID=2954046 RepID=UPI00222E7B2E|nr:hypothetical protein [Wolbachia endosymbiont (group A) of Philonthus cognatus]